MWVKNKYHLINLDHVMLISKRRDLYCGKVSFVVEAEFANGKDNRIITALDTDAAADDFIAFIQLNITEGTRCLVIT